MKITIPAIIAIALASSVSAQPKSASGPQELINLEAAWSKAAVARDSAALSRIIAADWHGQNERGKLMDRAAMIREAMNGPHKLTAMTNHDLHVRFIGGNHAIVQGMDDEAGTVKGKVYHQSYTWTDIFEKRGNSWVAIASQNTPVK